MSDLKIEIDKRVNGLKKDFSTIHDTHFVDVNEKIQRQPVCVSIGESIYKQKVYPIPFGSYGDYSCIVGSSKSKKTFLKSAIIAGFIGGQSTNYFPNIKGHHMNDKFIIDIDTEQSKYHSQRVFKRVCDMVGSNYELYKPFAIRTMSANERLEFIDWLIMESEYKNNIGLISIDGYADLVNNFNDLTEATNLQEKLLMWSAKGKCHITGVLHRNFGTQKPVGHVGSSVLKKAETVVFVEKDENSTKVTCEYSRNMPFMEFKFSVNNDWLPCLDEDIF